MKRNVLLYCSVFLLLPSGFPADPRVSANLPGTGSAQSGTANAERMKLAREIRAAVVQADGLALEAAGLKEQQRRVMTGLDTQIERLKNDIDRTDADLKAEKQAVEELRARIEEHRRKEEECRAFLARAAALAMNKVEQFSSDAEAGIPYRKTERLAMMKRILADLKTEDPSVQADALLRFWAFAAEECRAAQTVTLQNGKVCLDGGQREVHAYVGRIGLASEFFVSEDGHRIGLASVKPGEIWNGELPKRVCRQIRNAVQILKSQAPPQIIQVPFPVFSRTVDRTRPENSTE
ncbi:MAG: DUF3450 domain-containing protein [Pontiellaceae bacterium]|jgi:hypothetical protein|nr:DUF3450 domain-containing protein [Pontiellaceae bacterium]